MQQVVENEREDEPEANLLLSQFSLSQTSFKSSLHAFTGDNSLELDDNPAAVGMLLLVYFYKLHTLPAILVNDGRNFSMLFLILQNTINIKFIVSCCVW